MKSILVIPLRSLSDSKTRLKDNLDTPAFIRLCASSLVRAANTGMAIEEIVFISSSPEVKELAEDMNVSFFHSKNALNSSIEEFRTIHLQKNNRLDLIVCLGDLPILSDFDLVTEPLETNDLVLGSDRHGEGTNILGIKNDASWDFQFGERSLRKHMNQANKRRLKYKLLKNFSIGLDIDTIEDYEILNKFKEK